MTDWNSLHTLLAVVSTGSYADAARKLGIDETTVSRRVRALERDIGRRLLERGGRHLTTTPACQDILHHLEDAEASLDRTLEKLGVAEVRPIPTVRITSVDYVCDRLLAPAAHIIARGRNFRLELIGDDRNLNLRRHEADVALRLAKPASDLSHARFIADVEYAAYEAARSRTNTREWAALDLAQLHLQEVRWSEKEGSNDGVRFTATSFSSIHAMVSSGAATAFLPRFMAEPDTGLRRIEDIEQRTRPLWMIWHPEFEQETHFNTVADRITDTLREKLA
ncbi:MAG: LysR family transcriptional regulator [Pseudomonadota bacterium]